MATTTITTTTTTTTTTTSNNEVEVEQSFWFSKAAARGTIIVPGSVVKQLLPMRVCVEEVRKGFRALQAGAADLPLRLAYKLPQAKLSIMASMPAFMLDKSDPPSQQTPKSKSKADGGGDGDGDGATKEEEVVVDNEGIPFCSCKTISVFPTNSTLNKHSHQGTVSLYEAVYGALLAVVDAGEVTALRTAAASAVATIALARPGAKVLALVGCGVQAVSHVEAMLVACPGLTTVKVWSRNASKVEEFVTAQQQAYAQSKSNSNSNSKLTFEAVASVREATLHADVICTLTPSSKPFLEVSDVKPGCHINAVGGCNNVMRELCPSLVERASIFTDRMESCLKEPGEIVDCLKSGLITEEHIRGELGQVLAGAIPGRGLDDSEITVFESLGVAIQDLVAALRIYRNCLALKELPAGCVQVKF